MVADEESTAYRGVDLTNQQHRIIEYLAHHPDATSAECAEAVDVHPSYPIHIATEFGHVLAERCSELDTESVLLPGEDA